MYAGRRRIISFLLLAAVFSICQAEEFVLAEPLGHEWTNERVSFVLTAETAAMATQGQVLLGPDNEEVPYQLSRNPGQGDARLFFQTNLAPYETRRFRFAERRGGQPDLTDLKVHETADELRVENKLIGLSIRKKLKRGQGPISGIRLRSGVWTGDSHLARTSRVEVYTARITAHGPVFIEAECHVLFADGGHWNIRFRVENNEPVVLVEERFDAPGGGVLRVSLGDSEYRPLHWLYRSGSGGNLGKVSTQAIGPDGQFTLEPWLHWWESELQGNWFALYSPEPGAPDMLMLGLLRPGVWKNPDWQGKAAEARIKLQARADNGRVTVALPLGGGERHWMLATPDKQQSIDVLSQKQRRVSPLPQQYLIKHGDFPLDEVKEYVLEWGGESERHPRLYFDQESFKSLRELQIPDPVELERWERRQPIDKYNIEGPLREYFASGSLPLGEKIVATVSVWLDSVVLDDLLKQDSRVTLGVAPHGQAVLLLPTLNLVDAALGVDTLPAELHRRILARLAFLAYVVNSEHYWSPERGFAANPNMTTTVALYQVLLAALIPSHPLAREWAGQGLDTLSWQLENWSDEDGGWLEAPHYAVVAYDHLLAAFLAADRAGFGNRLYDERMRRIAEWLARISTPPDSRTDGLRHLPPIGNTYYGESSGIFCIVAGVWQEKDPAFAAQMQWMCEEQGSPTLGLGWSFPSMAGYTDLLKARNLAARQPAYGSAWFRQTGVVLRNGTGSGRETYLHMIAGENHEHYDHDSGSIILWGKGRLLADDWGYIGRHGEEFHNVLSSMAVHGTMRITEFSAQPALDYVSGQKLAWQRQIGFARDDDPLGPNFFLIRDTHHFGVRAEWRLWLTTDPDAGAVQILEDRVSVSGADDVVLELYFYQHGKLEMKTETVSQEMSVGRRDGKVGPMTLTQTAIIASTRKTGSVTVLAYPRLRTEPLPLVTWHADGHIAEVHSTAGTDYVFLGGQSRPPEQLFKIEDKDLSFRGSSGSVRVRGQHVTLSLGAAGRIDFGESSLVSESGPKFQVN